MKKDMGELFEDVLQLLKRGGARILNYIRRIPLLSFSLSPENKEKVNSRNFPTHKDKNDQRSASKAEPII
jgi:hypothetical protein